MLLHRVSDLMVGESYVYTVDWGEEAQRLKTSVQSAFWQVDGPLTIVSTSVEGDRARVRVQANSGPGEARLTCTATMTDNVHVLKTTLLVTVRGV